MDIDISQGGEKYQQAFYVFEELAQAPSTSSTQSLVSQAVAEIHLGRLEEAEAALQQALSKDATNADVIANLIVLNVINGKDAKEHSTYDRPMILCRLTIANAIQISRKHRPKPPLPYRSPRKERTV